MMREGEYSRSILFLLALARSFGRSAGPYQVNDPGPPSLRRARDDGIRTTTSYSGEPSCVVSGVRGRRLTSLRAYRSMRHLAFAHATDCAHLLRIAEAKRA